MIRKQRSLSALFTLEERLTGRGPEPFFAGPGRGYDNGRGCSWGEKLEEEFLDIGGRGLTARCVSWSKLLQARGLEIKPKKRNDGRCRARSKS